MTIHDDAERLAKAYDERVHLADNVWRDGLPRTSRGSETQAQHTETATLLRTLSTRLREAEARTGVPELTDEDRDWINNRADELFREYVRRRGGVGPASITARDYLDHHIIDATRERIRAAVEAVDLRVVREALRQYINDMKYPPERDSRERRIAMAQAALALIDGENGNG